MTNEPRIKSNCRSSRLQFSLRSILVVVLLFCVCMACMAIILRQIWRDSPDKLARQALKAQTVAGRVQAAGQLADYGYEARDQLQRVLRESNTPGVRAACIGGLGEIEDYDSMDLFIELLNDDSLVVRGSAGSVVTTMLMAHEPQFAFRANDPADKRQEAVKLLREKWEELRGTPLRPPIFPKSSRFIGQGLPRRLAMVQRRPPRTLNTASLRHVELDPYIAEMLPKSGSRAGYPARPPHHLASGSALGGSAKRSKRTPELL